MKRLRTVLLLLASTAALCGAAEVEVNDPAAAKALLQKILATADTTSRVQALIVQLGAESWDVREGATRELTALGSGAVPLLEKAAESDDPEIRHRAKEILKALAAAPQDASADLGKAIDVLAAARDKWVVAALLDLLGHARDDVRYAAEYGLRRIARRNFGYNALDDGKTRQAAVARWRAWWKDAEKSFAFDAKPPKPAQIAGVLVCSRRWPRVCILDLEGETVWSKDVPGRAYAADRLPNGHTVIVDSVRGVVEEYDPTDRVVWKSEDGAFRGSVMDVERLANGNTLVAHTSANLLAELDRQGKAVWSLRVDRSPCTARRLPNGNTLVAYWATPGKVVELTRGGKIAWAAEGLQMPGSAQKLPNGNVLIAEYRAKRIIEVDRKGLVVWQRECTGYPHSVVRLPDGSMVVSDTVEGVVLIGPDGGVLRTLDAEAKWGRVRLAPAVRTSTAKPAPEKPVPPAKP
ncbi:PQQ-binding-like beta-propeller repeat protein [bacterium]|nr:PQQ-binding-like beta-propeller repeat protein [bacterium]